MNQLAINKRIIREKRLLQFRKAQGDVFKFKQPIRQPERHPVYNHILQIKAASSEI